MSSADEVRLQADAVRSLLSGHAGVTRSRCIPARGKLWRAYRCSCQVVVTLSQDCRIRENGVLLSRLLNEIDNGMKWAGSRFGDGIVAFAVGSVRGGWKSFAGIQLDVDNDENVAVVSTGKGYYGGSGTMLTDFRLQVADFIAVYGDMLVALKENDELVTRLDVVVDQETDGDGNRIGLVLLLQGYIVKASARP